MSVRPQVAVCVTHYELGGQRTVLNEQTRLLSDSYDITIVTEEQRIEAPPWCRLLIAPPWKSRLDPRPVRKTQNLLGAFDLVHCHESFAYIWEAAKNSRPLVVTSHGNCPAKYRKELSSKLEYWASEPLYGLAYRKADAVFGISRYVQRWLAKRYGVDALLCPNGVNLGAYSVGPEPRERAFLYVGELSERKGVPALVDGFRRARKVDPSLNLWLVGQGPLMEPLGRLPAEEKVCLFGSAAPETLSSLYARCMAFITASYWEGFCLPILEAFASGTPVAARDAYAMSELLRSPLAGIKFRNDCDIKDAILLLASRSEVDREMLREEAEKYPWELGARVIRDVYARLLA
ncbi:MAG TPA: glycosyltransferase family 4 protein [Candidatus Rubrimentiphilum sp.]|nr:glycosyltransferase family 4 protein [Candidatus Rubrimentiphilum sp.]